VSCCKLLAWRACCVKPFQAMWRAVSSLSTRADARDLAPSTGCDEVWEVKPKSQKPKADPLRQPRKRVRHIGGSGGSGGIGEVREGLSVRPENVGDRRMRDGTFSSVIGVGVLFSEHPLTIRLVASAGRRLRRNARPWVK
jgi:hypothetical protein